MANEGLYISVLGIVLIVALLFMLIEWQKAPLQTQQTAAVNPSVSHYIILPPKPVAQELSPTIYKLVSPSPGADIESILSYLLERGHALDGTPWSTEIRTALTTRTAWQPSGGTPPSYFYPSGLNTQSSFLIYYDDASGNWSIRPGR